MTDHDTTAASAPAPGTGAGADTSTAAPMLRITSPHTTPEEVAAIVAVLASLGGVEQHTPRPRPEWNTPHRLVRRPVSHGPNGWRASALPR
ncbi:MAG: acyl-CoA carboxylase subunit epsilon [Nocardioides sp.]